MIAGAGGAGVFPRKLKPADLFLAGEDKRGVAPHGEENVSAVERQAVLEMVDDLADVAAERRRSPCCAAELETKPYRGSRTVGREQQQQQ